MLLFFIFSLYTYYVYRWDTNKNWDNLSEFIIHEPELYLNYCALVVRKNAGRVWLCRRLSSLGCLF